MKDWADVVSQSRLKYSLRTNESPHQLLHYLTHSRHVQHLPAYSAKRSVQESSDWAAVLCSRGHVFLDYSSVRSNLGIASPRHSDTVDPGEEAVNPEKGPEYVAGSILPGATVAATFVILYRKRSLLCMVRHPLRREMSPDDVESAIELRSLVAPHRQGVDEHNAQDSARTE